MTKEEKYKAYKELFYNNFIYDDNSDIPGSNIPLSRINFDSMSGEMGDGTINLASYIQYIFTCVKLGESTEEELNKVLSTLRRLIDGCYQMFVDKCPNVYFKKEPGFFLRDDVNSSLASKFGLKSIRTGYSSGIERIDEDPYFSPFVSQDQIWNLVPILSYLSDTYEKAKELGKDITEYVIKNKHVIYNPYYSALYHNWTYLRIFEPYWERINERNRKLKYTIKVKRGANNWYFSYGFKKTYNNFGGNSKTFWSSIWYKPFIFLADRLYHPYICKWFKLPVKNTSYYSLAIAGNAWYGGNYESRIVKKFNKSLETSLRDGSELFMPQLAFLTSKRMDINLNLLGEYIEKYPTPNKSGWVNSPLDFMLLYNQYKLLKNDTRSL